MKEQIQDNMDQKQVNQILIIAGIVLIITGIMQILSQPGIWNYLSTLAGALLVCVGLYGLKKDK